MPWPGSRSRMLAVILSNPAALGRAKVSTDIDRQQESIDPLAASQDAVHMARILVADDNLLSLEFLAEAISSHGHRVDRAMDGLQAFQLASTCRYDLMLIDSLMPHRSGVETIRMLRAGGGPSCNSTALATSADAGVDRKPLHEAGFSAVMIKPTPLEAIREMLDNHLPAGDSGRHSLNDDLALAKLGGDRVILDKLRGLLALELDALPAEINALSASRNLAALHDRLHRLDASAGFCGAIPLTTAVQHLRLAIQASGEWPNKAVDAFLRASAETRTLLG